ncbi:DUF4097 domain-containing protein [Lactobacillus sp. PV037]|uniref:DUF4097 family beta strand repeat-containing protein n=1 Tax=unclassified Lactobacillus TaxID=2620435 RepID=UPI00223F2F7E|nr:MULTISPECIES: DUF4097 family beta strand repeat-containing protein [unclassified Lactobacillus]QNQ82523.1 DUF4097 domain-containing protein [Lactobacillus sp. PV012]QNQ83361.1 DUF4097 domain-containing protein [Lactobacillus sp. PV037]
MFEKKIDQLFEKLPQTSSLTYFRDMLQTNLQLILDENLQNGKNKAATDKKINKYFTTLEKVFSQVTPDTLERLNTTDIDKFLSKIFDLEMVNELHLELNQIDELHLNYRFCDLIILPSFNDQAVLQDYMSRDIPKLHSTIEKIGNVIKIKQGPRKLVGIFKAKVLLFLPNSYTGFLSIRNQSGHTSVYRLRSQGLLDITGISGNLLLKNLHVKRLQADSKSGNVHLEDCNAESVHINSHSGELVIDTLKVLGQEDDASFTTNNGSITLHYVSANQLYLATKSGTLTLENCQALLSKINTNSGNVKITESNLNSRITTQSGNIKALLSDQFSSKIALTTKTGNIKIKASPNLLFTFSISSIKNISKLPLESIIFDKGSDDIDGYVGNENAKANLTLKTISGKIKITDE